MMTTANKTSINLGNPSKALADCLIKTNNAYLGLMAEGASSDRYKEVGRTVRHLARCLSDASLYSESSEEDADDDHAEEEVDPAGTE
jgi:hypothetical protein